jgi:ATP-dependent DNA helicase RecQ
MRLASPEQRLAWLLAHLDSLPGSGIVYTLTVSAAEDIAAALREAGHEVRAYTGRTDPADRERLEASLRDNEVKALIATSALGMGFDKPDLGFVLHLGAPSSPVAYYQQVGRAGRATERADVLLLPGPDDRDIWAYFASASMPQQEQADAVLRALAAARSPLSTVALESMVDVRRTRLELLLKVLDVDGAVRRVAGGWTSTGEPWTYDAERYARVSAARVREQELMLTYEKTGECRMAFLQESLDDESAQPCGRCDSCAGIWFPTDLPDSAVTTARGRLERAGVEVEPRAQWPSGMQRLGVPLKGKIPADQAMASGRAVARLSDLGWGQQLRALLRAPDAPAPSTLIQACVPILRDWDWTRRPAAVVSVPSRQRPRLVESVATGIAELGRLRSLGSLDLVESGPVGEPGGNSAFRLAGVWGRLAVGPELRAALAGLEGPVLLVDDLASSRWTLTVAAQALREAGATTVLPFVLAVEG